MVEAAKDTPAAGACVDVVVVSYNSHDCLRASVDRLVGDATVHVIVVDNASPDSSLETVRDLPLTAIQLEKNGGFAVGVNVGWRAGASPYVLLLNPDARIDRRSLGVLTAALEADPDVGAVAPRIVDRRGSVDYSQRRYPRLRSTYARAFFLHRIFPGASWTDELVRDAEAYERRGEPDWVSGACMLIRRSVLERLSGLDEGFFMYAEDIDLCRRIRSAGYRLVFEPAATVQHEGGASAPRTELLAELVASRLRYASKHRSKRGAFLERVGLALDAAIRIVVSRGGVAARAGHARALRRAVARPTNS